MCPGHHEHAQGIVIEYVHAVVFYPGCYGSAGLGPLGQETASIGVSEDNSKQRLVTAISACGHASVEFDPGPGV
jgi:hypothetical protein